MIENSEKELLKEDLENQGTPEAINKFIEDAELLGHEDIAELGRKKLQEISEKAKSIETTSESQASSVESMGGTGEEVTERTKEVDSKIEEVQTEAVKQIEEVKNIPEGDLKKEKTIDEIEREKQSVKDLDQLKKIKEHPDYNNLIQIATELRALHKVNKEKGSEEALQNYRRKEEGLNKLVDKIAGDSGLSSYKILSASEILNIDKTINESGVSEKDESIKKKEEKIKEFEKEMTVLLDKTLSGLPGQMKEYFNSEEYKKLIELNKRKNEEEKSLFEAYERYTKGGDESHRRGFGIGRGTAHYYVDDMKFNKAPAEIIKRFEDFDEKIAKPTFDAEWPNTLKARETILKDKNAFLDSLQKKVNEDFKDDNQGREEAYKKGLDSYNEGYNKIKNETSPDQQDRINTYGTIYS